jgi:hypothetical protein
MKNPWPGMQVALHRNNAKAESIGGDVLTFDTSKGESIQLLRANATLQQLHRSLPE